MARITENSQEMLTDSGLGKRHGMASEKLDAALECKKLTLILVEAESPSQSELEQKERTQKYSVIYEAKNSNENSIFF